MKRKREREKEEEEEGCVERKSVKRGRGGGATKGGAEREEGSAIAAEGRPSPSYIIAILLL